jgi:hypothetical protein
LYERAVYAVNTLSAAEKQFLIDNGYEDLIKGSIKGDIFGELSMLGLSYAAVQGLILSFGATMTGISSFQLPVWAKTLLAGGAATGLTPSFAYGEEMKVDDETPTMKMEVIGKPITQWYDLEGEFDYNVPMLIFEKTKLQTIIQQE